MPELNSQQRALVVIFITYSILKLVPTLTRPSYTFGYFPEFANLAVQVISLGGASHLAPAHSRAAILLAVDAGADGVFTVVQPTADGVPILAEPGSLWAVGGGGGGSVAVSDVNWGDLQCACADGCRPDLFFPDEPILTLGEAVELASGPAPFGLMVRLVGFGATSSAQEKNGVNTTATLIEALDPFRDNMENLLFVAGENDTTFLGSIQRSFPGSFVAIELASRDGLARLLGLDPARSEGADDDAAGSVDRALVIAVVADAAWIDRDFVRMAYTHKIHIFATGATTAEAVEGLVQVPINAVVAHDVAMVAAVVEENGRESRIHVAHAQRRAKQQQNQGAADDGSGPTGAVVHAGETGAHNIFGDFLQ